MLRQDVDNGAETAWWVLQTAPRQERPVCRQLATLDMEHYAPELPHGGQTRAGSVRDRRSRMVFPGYVFCCPAQNASVHHAIRWAPGVVRILGEDHDHTPAAVPDAVIRHLRQRIAETSAGARHRGFVRGEQVVIESGPMASLDAIFDRHLGAATRVRILVEMMGHTVPMHIDPMRLRSFGS